MTEQKMLPGDPIKHIVAWFDKARPESSMSDFQSQLGCHFEEVREMIEEVQGLDPIVQKLLDEAARANHNLAEYLKNNANRPTVQVAPDHRIGFIDAIADQLVTATGSAHALGMDPHGAAREVSWSNWTKFDPATGEPIRNPDTLKIMKGPAYQEADLTPYI